MTFWRAPVSASSNWVAAAIVPTLNGLLKDKDAGVREEAALAFCGIDRKAIKDALPALTELLRDQNERVRRNAASALSFKGPTVEPSIPDLVLAIKQDASPKVRSQAAVALMTGGSKAVESLVRMLDDKNVLVRRAVVGVFEFTYPDESPEKTRPAAAPKLVARLQDESPDIRKSAAIALARISDLPLEVIAALLHHQDIEVRHVAAATLLSGDKTAKRLQAELLEFMNGDMAFCRTNAGALGCVGPKSVPILVKLLDDYDPAVRGAAASSLGGVGPAAKEAVGALKRLLTDLAEIPNTDLDDRVCHRAGVALNQILGDKDYREGLPPKRPDGM